MPLQESLSATKVNFRFKTHRPNGMILLAAGTHDYLLIVLEDALIKVRINLGTGEAWLASNSELKLNDLRWHEVNVERLGTELSMSGK